MTAAGGLYGLVRTQRLADAFDEHAPVLAHLLGHDDHGEVLGRLHPDAMRVGGTGDDDIGTQAREDPKGFLDAAADRDPEFELGQDGFGLVHDARVAADEQHERGEAVAVLFPASPSRAAPPIRTAALRCARHPVKRYYVAHRVDTTPRRSAIDSQSHTDELALIRLTKKSL